jgi:hypothetical protein
MKKIISSLLFFVYIFIGNNTSAQVNKLFSTHNYTAIDQNMPVNIVPGSILNLDAANTSSYIGSGTSWNDLSGNGNHVTLPSTLASSFTSTNGGSFLFGQTSSHSIVDNSLTNFGFASNAITVEVWYKRAVTTDYQFWFSDNTANFRFGITSAGNYFWNMGSRTDRQNTSFTLATGIWKHVVFTGGVEAGSIVTRLYVDGAFVFSQNEGYSTLRSMSGFLIGAGENNGVYLLKGNLAVVRVYQKALSANEVTQNFNATKTRFGL